MLRLRAKTAALALMLVLCAGLLGGCSSQLEEREMTDVSLIPIVAQQLAPVEDTFADSKARVMLYFLSDDGSRLVPVSREIDVPGGVSTARSALQALLGGPQENESGNWPDLGLPIVARSMEISGGVAVVDLPARVRTLPQETLYGIRMAIACTLTEFTEIDAVNVLIGGREEGFDLGATLPVGTLQRTADLEIGASYARLDGLRQAGGAFEQRVTLYLPTADGRFVLPQVFSVDYVQMTPIEYLYTLLETLGTEAGGSAGFASVPAPMLFINEMPEIVRTDDGAYRAIEIQFEAALDEALAASGLTREIYLAMLTHTLMGAVPGVEGLKVHIGDEVLTSLSAQHTRDGRAFSFAQVLATRDDFVSCIGAPVTVYAIDGESGRLTAEERVLAHEKSRSPRALLETLVAMWGDRAATSALSGADILAVSVDGEEITVNLSAAFADALRALEPQDAKAAVYAMVNTLTQNHLRGNVTFFFDGVQMEEPLGGVEMRGSLARNPGMVVD